MPGVARIPDGLIEALTPFFCRREDGCGGDVDVYGDYSTAEQTRTDTSFATTDTAVTFTVVVPSYIIANATADLDNDTAGVITYMAIFIDSTQISEPHSKTGPGALTRSAPAAYYVAAGTYTVSIQWRSGTAGQNANIDNKYLTVVVGPA